MGLVLLGLGLVVGFFLLPQTIPIPTGVRTAGNGFKTILVVAVLCLLAPLAWSALKSAFPDADVRGCADKYGDSYSPDYQDDDYVYCVDDATGDGAVLHSK